MWLLVALLHFRHILTYVHLLAKIPEGFLLLWFWSSVSTAAPRSWADLALDSTFPAEGHISHFLALPSFPTLPRFLNPSAVPSGINGASSAKSSLQPLLWVFPSPFCSETWLSPEDTFSSAALSHGGYFFSHCPLTAEYGYVSSLLLIASLPFSLLFPKKCGFASHVIRLHGIRYSSLL